MTFFRIPRNRYERETLIAENFRLKADTRVQHLVNKQKGTENQVYETTKLFTTTTRITGSKHVNQPGL